jgi:hypothetical protein
LQAIKTRGFVKIKHLLVIIFLFTCARVLAQEEGRGRMYPIEEIQQGFRKKYTYNRQVIENPLGLQIPLLESKDPEVSLEYHRFKSKRNLMNWISSVGAGLSIYSWLNPGKVSDGFSLATVGTAALVNIYLGSMSMRHLNRALSKYNSLVNARPQVSLEFTPNAHTSGGSLALQWKYNF